MKIPHYFQPVIESNNRGCNLVRRKLVGVKPFAMFDAPKPYIQVGEIVTYENVKHTYICCVTWRGVSASKFKISVIDFMIGSGFLKIIGAERKN